MIQKPSAEILYVTDDGIPKVTLNEIKRLGDTGISRDNDHQGASPCA